MTGIFAETPFAVGCYRVVYKGTYTASSKEKKLCVYKEDKDPMAWAGHDYKTRLEVHRIAKGLADSFNNEKISGMAIEFANISAYFCDSKKWSGCTREDSVIVVEDFIPGKFRKWCNNYGNILERSNTLPALMHWSYVQTEGRLMIADLQGVLTDAKYLLTDPVIMSNSTQRLYGKSDTGVEGMIMFFSKHSCSYLCAQLPRPPLNIVVALRPPFGCDRVVQLKMSTALAHDRLMGSATREWAGKILKGLAKE